MKRMIIATLLSGLVLTCLGQSGVRAEVLITADEAKLPASGAPPTRGLTRGPGIDQESPAPNQSARSPMPFRIRFEARNNIDIDPATVKLIYMKAVPVDLTDRVRRYTTAQGIVMDHAEVPPGIHLLRLDLKDVRGRPATAVIKLVVADK